MVQVERGVAYSYYVENAAAHPAIIGTHWYQWIDQPATGRRDGENYNIGLPFYRMVGEFLEYRPYEDMAEFDREIGKYVDEAEVARFRRYVTL